MGKLSFEARKIFSVIVAVLGAVFALFLGMAYMLYTIVFLEHAAFTDHDARVSSCSRQFGGVFVLALATKGNLTLSDVEEKRVFGVFTLGALVALIGVIVFFVDGVRKRRACSSM